MADERVGDIPEMEQWYINWSMTYTLTLGTPSVTAGLLEAWWEVFTIAGYTELELTDAYRALIMDGNRGSYHNQHLQQMQTRINDQRARAKMRTSSNDYDHDNLYDRQKAIEILRAYRRRKGYIQPNE